MSRTLSPTLKQLLLLRGRDPYIRNFVYFMDLAEGGNGTFQLGERYGILVTG